MDAAMFVQGAGRLLNHIVVIVLLLQAGMSSVQGASGFVPEQALVKMRAAGGVRALQATDSLRRLGAVSQTAIGESGWRLVTLPAGTDVPAWTRSLRDEPSVAAAEPNYRHRLHATVNDRLAPLLYGLGQIGATSAWNSVTGSNSVVVAVMDTGINLAHPDLAPALWVNTAEVAGNGVDDDSNGVVDDIHGADFVNGDGNPSDDAGHGSHVAGTIAAVGNNTTGVVGVAYGCKILPVRILSEDGAATSANIVRAFDYVRSLRLRGVNVRVINNSWGGEFPSLAIFEAVTRTTDAGILNVCSSGNDGYDNDVLPTYPSSYNSIGVLSVAANDSCDLPSEFSNFGPRSVHLSAPGSGIYSTFMAGDSYAMLSGTSMAAPHVSGAAALLLSKRPSLTLSQLRALLLSSVDAVPAWQSRTTTGGRLNVGKAIAFLDAGGTPPSSDPTNAVPAVPIRLVSRSYTNRLAMDASFTSPFPGSLSADGRYVVFLSQDTNLVQGDVTANTDVFLRDTWSNTTVRVSQTLAGVGANDDSTSAVISSNGAYVAFTTYANNLVAGDNNGSLDVIVWDRQTRALQRISKRPGGTFFSLDSLSPSINGDGSVVAFAADEPVGGGSIRDIYVWTRNNDTTRIINLSPGNAFADDWSDGPSISADGRYVAYYSWAANLVASDSNNSGDVFVYDRTGNTTERVSITGAGQQGNADSFYCYISGDGRWVTFNSRASNLGVAAPGQGIHTYLHDRNTDQIRVVSRNADGVPLTGTNYVEAISGDGRFVVFLSRDETLFPARGFSFNRPFVYDRLTDALSPVAVNPAGFSGDDTCFYPHISPDGRRVLFTSYANNLVPDDGNAVLDVFLLDRGTNFADLQLRRTGPGTRTGGGLVGPNLPQRASQTSADGTPVSFEFRLFNSGLVTTSFLVKAVAPAGWQMTVTAGAGPGTNATAVAVAGTWSSGVLVPGASNSFSLQIARTSLLAAAVGSVRVSVRSPAATNEFDVVEAVATWPAPPPGLELASRNTNGAASLLNAESPGLSGDGRLVVFHSSADNLLPGDVNFQADAFVLDRQNGSLRKASEGADGTPGNADSLSPNLSRTGRFVAFESYSDNLVPGDFNDVKDVFLKDLQTGAIEIVGLTPLGPANRGCEDPMLSGEGRYVLFQSIASNLVAGDTNGCTDLFLKDRSAGGMECVSKVPGGAWANGPSRALGMTPDGRFILFLSFANNLVASDTNGFPDIFLLDRQNAQIELVSQGLGGAAAAGPSLNGSLSDYGRFVVFRTDASNVVAGATTRVFVLDRQTGQRTGLESAAVGLPAGMNIFSAKISPDGEWLAIQAAPGCGGAETNLSSQLYLHRRDSGQSTLVSRTRDGRAAEKDSFSPGFSGDSRYLVFASGSRVLLSQEQGRADQVFLHDRADLQPDAALRRETDSDLRGLGIVGSTNAVMEQPLRLNTPRTFFLLVTNLSNFGGSVRLTGPVGDGVSWRARYFDDASGGIEITSAVANGWEYSPTGTTLNLQVRVVVTLLGASAPATMLFQVSSVPHPVLTEQVVIAIPADSDADNLSDTWEKDQFGNLATAGLGTDFDQDGSTDLSEYVAGTNPKSAASVLRLGSPLGFAGGVSVVVSNTHPGRFYSLETTKALGTAFLPAVPMQAGNGSALLLQAPVEAGTTNLFLRVRAALP